MAIRILLVDDEPMIIKGLRYALEKEGYEIVAAQDGEEALDMFNTQKVDFILLDLMLPKMDGIQVCQQIRETSTVPIIMLTAKDDDMSKITGLDIGADDYMTKPFNTVELKMRIKTILRRVSKVASTEEDTVYKVRDLEVNVINRSVTLAGQEIRLTAKEFDLLLLFLNNRGKVFTRDEMLEAVWKNDYDGEPRTVDVHIRRLREKIERDSTKPEFVFTRWGVGYYFAGRDD